MRLSKFGFVLAATIILSSCTPPKFVPGLMVKWDHKLGYDRSSSSVPSRMPAQTGPRCLKDRVATQYLREDIQLEEKKRPAGDSIQSLWNNLDLSKIPRVQGQFLLSAGNRLHVQGVDFSRCQDSMCVLNQIYGNTGLNEGEKVYWWYLKTGYYLNSAALMPDLPSVFIINPAVPGAQARQTVGKPYKDYLFPAEQLNALWRLSWSLPSTFWNITKLQSFYRLPKGFSAYDSDTCADATATGDLGYIRLFDVTYPSDQVGYFNYPCLELAADPLKNHPSRVPYFYNLVTHEMSHSIDYSRNKFSRTPAWLDLSGWTAERIVDANKNVVMQWSSDPKKEKFCTQYAATLPGEDWAESVMCFRYEADTLLKAAPSKFNLVRDKVYQGREYTQAGQNRFYVDRAVSSIKPRLTEILDLCLGQKPEVENIPEEQRVRVGELEFLGARTAECIDKALGVKVNQEVAKLNLSDWDACDYFDAQGVDQAFRKQISEQVGGHLRQLATQRQELVPRLQAVKNFRRDLSLGLDARDVYRHCYRPEGDQTPQDCYLKRLTQGFVEISKPYQEAAGDLLQPELELFLKENSYEEAAQQTMAFFRLIFGGSEPWVEQSAEERWKACETANPVVDIAQAKLTPFTGGSFYVDAGVLQCINERSDEDLSSVRRQMASRLGLIEFDQLSILMIHDLFLPTYLSTLQKKLEEKFVLEKARWDKEKKTVEEKVKTRIAALDPTWLIGESPLQSCQGSVVTAQSVSELAWRSPFLSVVDLINQVAKPICQQSLTSWTQSWGTLERSLVIRARAQGQQCHRSVARAQRKNCLVNQWSGVESLALRDWRGVPVSLPHRALESTLVQTALQQSRERIQNAAVAEMERL